MRILTILAALAALQLRAVAGPIIYITDFFNDPHQFGTLDLGTGAFKSIGTTSAGEIFSGPGGSVYALDESGNLFRTASNGATTLVGSTGLTPDEPAGLADGTIYMDDLVTHKLYTINPLTGASTLVGSTGFTNPAGGGFFLTLIGGQTNTLYGLGASFDSAGNVIDHQKLYQINRSTGAATFLANVNDDDVFCALIVGGAAYLFDGTAVVETLNLTTGQATPLYDLSGSLAGINGIAIVTPEPATWLMASLAGAALLWVRRRPAQSR